jgi:hypothetical protein
VSDLCTTEVYEDFYKCYDVATHAASYWPDAPGVWAGTVSERLGLLFRLEHEARVNAEIELERLRTCKHERLHLKPSLQDKINPVWPDDYDLPG